MVYLVCVPRILSSLSLEYCSIVVAEGVGEYFQERPIFDSTHEHRQELKSFENQNRVSFF
jgi:hypothetical protein